MEEDDYRSLIDLVKGQMADYNLAELAADENYYIQFGEDEDVRLPPPRKNLLHLLEAFRVHVKLSHQGTVEHALERIGEVCREARPEDAILVVPTDTAALREISLSKEIPDRTEVLEQLDELLEALRLDSGPEPEFGL